MIIKKAKSVNKTVVKANKHEEAVKHIKAAIDVLGPSAKKDIIAKESIANLSVVLMDLIHQ